jgi:hypothetical protein
MNIGTAGDSLSLARVMAAMLIGGAGLGGIGYLFDLAIGPAITMSGWWTVFSSGGVCLAGMVQAAREFTVPQPAERRAVAAEARARAAAEAADEAEATPEAAPPASTV